MGGFVKKLKIKTNKAASKRFTLRKRSPFKIFAVPLNFLSGDCTGEEAAEKLEGCDGNVPFLFARRSRYVLKRTVACARHQRRRRSSRSLRRPAFCLASMSDAKRRYPLRIKKK